MLWYAQFYVFKREKKTKRGRAGREEGDKAAAAKATALKKQEMTRKMKQKKKQKI